MARIIKNFWKKFYFYEKLLPRKPLNISTGNVFYTLSLQTITYPKHKTKSMTASNFVSQNTNLLFE